MGGVRTGVRFRRPGPINQVTQKGCCQFRLASPESPIASQPAEDAGRTRVGVGAVKSVLSVECDRKSPLPRGRWRVPSAGAGLGLLLQVLQLFVLRVGFA